MTSETDHAPSVAEPQITAAAHAPLSPGTVAMATLIVVTIVGLCWIIVDLSRFFMLVFAAIVLGAVFDAVAQWIFRIPGMRRGVALALSIIGIITLFIGAFVLFGSQLASEFDTIRETLPKAIKGLEGFLDRNGLGERAAALTEIGSEDISRLVSQAGGYALAVSSGIADFVLVLVGAIFLAADPATYRRGFLLLIPAKGEPVAEQALDDASRGLRGWMMGQSVSSLVVGVLTWIALTLLEVPAAGGLGIIAGLLDIIPLIGPVIAGVPAVLLAFTVSPMVALWTLLVFLGIQQLQGNFLQPMIQKHAVDVPPALLLFAVLAAGLLFGFIGVLLAAPLTIVTFVFVQRIYVRAILGKPIRIVGKE
ncbi:AI-2E family transporter [Blastomonas sp.]|uniref:AI-2E family transporter n=1 Tax=Blastomonas sp. TaxID=1909299 RepID=UPI0035944034